MQNALEAFSTYMIEPFGFYRDTPGNVLRRRKANATDEPETVWGWTIYGVTFSAGYFRRKRIRDARTLDEAENWIDRQIKGRDQSRLQAVYEL